MTNRERVMTALEHRSPDRVPYHIEFTVPAHEAMVRYTGDPDFATKLGNALTVLEPLLPNAWREVEPGIWADQFGVRWNRTVDKDIGVVCNQVVTQENVDSFRLPDPHEAARYAAIEAAVKAPYRGFTVVNLGFSLYERAWTLAGMEQTLMAMAADAAFVHRLMDRILAYNLAVIEHACSYGVDAMMFGDDWGHQHGLIMGYSHWREFILPRIRQMYAAVHMHGKRVFIHSCGKVDSLFPDLIRAGVDVFNPFQPEVIDVEEAKRVYGSQLCFYGGISTQRLLPYGTSQEVRDQVRRLIDTVGVNGGYIAAPAHAIPGDARPENVEAMIDVLRNQ